MRPSRYLPILAVAALAAAGWWLAQSDGATVPTAASRIPNESPVVDEARPGGGFAVDERETDADAEPHAGFATATTNAAPAATDPRLFDATVPLRERIEHLDRRARGGDAAAGCQLAIELVRCGNERNMAGYHANAEQRVQQLAAQNLTAEQLRNRVDFELGRLQNNRAVLASCEGVQAADWAAPARYLRAAAERGHADAMRLFLDEALWRTDVLMRDPSLVGLLRADAPRYFHRLLQDGDLALVDRLANVNGGDPLPEVLPAPWNRPGLGSELRRLQGEARGSAPFAAHEPVDAETAALASEAFNRWFSRSEPTPSAGLGELRMGKVDAFGCDELTAEAAR